MVTSKPVNNNDGVNDESMIRQTVLQKQTSEGRTTQKADLNHKTSFPETAVEPSVAPAMATPSAIPPEQDNNYSIPNNGVVTEQQTQDWVAKHATTMEASKQRRLLPAATQPGAFSSDGPAIAPNDSDYLADDGYPSPHEPGPPVLNSSTSTGSQPGAVSVSNENVRDRRKRRSAPKSQQANKQQYVPNDYPSPHEPGPPVLNSSTSTGFQPGAVFVTNESVRDRRKRRSDTKSQRVNQRHYVASDQNVTSTSPEIQDELGNDSHPQGILSSNNTREEGEENDNNSGAVTATVITQEQLHNEVRQQMAMENASVGVVPPSKVGSGGDGDVVRPFLSKVVYLATLAVIAAVITVVVLVFTVSFGNNDNGNSSPADSSNNYDNGNSSPADSNNNNDMMASPTPSPNQPPVVPPTDQQQQEGDNAAGFSAFEQSFLQFLQDRGSTISFDDQTTPQFQAYLWAIQDPTILSYYDGGASNDDFESRFGLATLYFSTNGPEWTRSDNWLTEEEACSWYLGEVQPCSSGGKRIEHLTLSNNNLQGTIPPEIGWIKLKTFDLSYNNLSGTFPDDLRFSNGVEYLDVSQNQLTGEIPSRDLEKYKDLYHLDMSSNLFTGNFPDDIFEDPDFIHIDLSYNNFKASSIPASISALAQMTHLALTETSLTGSIPASLGSLMLLQALDLSGNALDQTIPDDIWRLPSLETLYLQNNQLTGTLLAETPMSSPTLSTLASIRLDGNNIVGEIPSFLCDRHNEFNEQQQQGDFELYADCGELACSCCSHCCFDDEEKCNPV